MIKPEAIPQFTGNLGQLEKDYGSLKTDAGHIRSTGSDVHTQFQGLSAYYQAPEAEKLFASTKPVQDRADGFADDLEKSPPPCPTTPPKSARWPRSSSS